MRDFIFDVFVGKPHVEVVFRGVEERIIAKAIVPAAMREQKAGEVAFKEDGGALFVFDVADGAAEAGVARPGAEFGV